MAHLYYDENLPAALAVGDTVTVAGEEARHAVSVARLRAGERVFLGNGRGLVATVEVLNTVAGKQSEFTVRVAKVQHKEAVLPRLVLAQALAKGDRAERAVELCCELGVDVIVPWQAARSVAVWAGAQKQERGVAKWQKVAREAAKQSLRAYVPQVAGVCLLAGLVELAARPGALLLVLDPWQQQSLTHFIADRAAAGELAGVTEIVVVVGPEGGLTQQEVAALCAAGGAAVVLGENVLRTSTAGAAAFGVLKTLLNLW